MSALSIQPTYPIFTDIDGQPLEAGYVWIGTANLDPQTNPINVYWDAALTILAPQPIRTLAGYPSNNGTPARLYVNSDYSIRVMNKNGSTVYSAPTATERYSEVVFNSNASQVIYDPAGLGAVPTTVQTKLRETVSVKDFGAIGNGIANDSPAIQAAFDYLMTVGGGTMYIPGTPTGYKLDNPLNFTSDNIFLQSFTPILIKGDGVVDIPDSGGIYATTLLANTGTGTTCIDITGHENVFFENFKIDGFNSTICTTPSRIGILAGRDISIGKDQWHLFRNFAIFLPTTNNAANPSIGLYNVATEIGQYENCTFFADLPHALVATNNTAAVNYNVSSAFVTLNNGPASCSVNTYTNCIFSSTSALVGARVIPVLHLDACYSNSFINCYFGDTGTTATSSEPVIKLTGGMVKDIHFLNFVNEATGDLFGGTVQNLRYNKFIGHNNAFDPAYALAKLNVGILISNDFDISESDAAVGPYNAYNMTLGVGGNPFFGNSNSFNLCVHGDFFATYAVGAITGPYRNSWKFSSLSGFPSQNITYNGGTAGMDVWTMNGNQMIGLLLNDGKAKTQNTKTIDTTPATIASVDQSGALALVQVFNDVGGSTGVFLLAWQYTGNTVTTIASNNSTGLTFTFSTNTNSNDLVASVAAGSATSFITLLV